MGTKKDRIRLAIREELLGRLTSGEDKKKKELSANWLYGEFLPSLNQKEVQALEEVLAEMIADGVIEHVRGRRPTYRLTTGQRKE